MIIFYDLTSLIVQYTVTQFGEEYRAYLDTVTNWVEWNDIASIEQLRLVREGDQVVVNVIPFMQIVCPASMMVGVEAVFSGIPEGASVIVNGTTVGTMDSSGILEFTPDTGGKYEFRFEHPNYVTFEVSREAQPS